MLVASTSATHLVLVIHSERCQALAQLPHSPEDAMPHVTLAGGFQHLEHLHHQLLI